MADYRAPLHDMMFVLQHIAGLETIAGFPEFGHATVEMTEGVLQEAARLFEAEVAPLNRVGDLEGSRVVAGSVVTAPGWKEAYSKYVDAGWGALPFPEEHGGGAFPWLAGLAVQEILTASNMAFSLGPLLTQGAIHAVLIHGDETLQGTFLPPMISGEWTGTMDLTEPQAGTDVGQIKTKAVLQADGTYRISGQKIFITYGDHDMADNIIHLVLAKTPDAPAGTKGISMFIVPKVLVKPDGSLGERNDVKVVSVEHKLGIHASPTCVMAFGDSEGAVGYLVGEEMKGMSYMFTMMNSARLSVGLEGLAISERAYQQAVQYAYDRKQGTAIGAPKGEQSSIVEHANVKRMLLTQKAYIEAMRCLMYDNAAFMDAALHDPDADARVSADLRAQILTPLSKAWGTDLGVELTSLALQVHGGMGYIEETGVAQHFRDARIAPIYEGTNGVQAMDLVARKLPLAGGEAVSDLITWMTETAAAAGEAGLGNMQAGVMEGVAKVTEAVMFFMGSQNDFNAVLSGATPFATLLGQVVAGAYMAKAATVATQLLAAGEGDEDFLRQKLVTSTFYIEQLLPQAYGLLPSITAGSKLLFEASF